MKFRVKVYDRVVRTYSKVFDAVDEHHAREVASYDSIDDSWDELYIEALSDQYIIEVRKVAD